MSQTRKTWMGCAFGCGALILLAIGSCIGFTAWIQAPGDVLQPERLLSAETTGYVEWTLRLEDPGTGEFFELLLQTFQGMGQEFPAILPKALSGPLQRMEQKSQKKKLRRIFPVVLVWTLEPRGDSEEDHVLSASLRGLDHQLLVADWALGLFLGQGDDTEVLEYKNEKIFLIDQPNEGDTLPVFLHRGDAFFTTSQAAARRTVDRLKSPAMIPAGPDLEAWLQRTPEGSLRGALDNRRGEVWRSWREFLDPELDSKVSSDLQEALEGLVISGSFTSQGSFLARATFHFQKLSDAELGVTPIRLAIADLIEDTPLEIDAVSSAGNVLHFDLKIADIPTRLPRPERLGRASSGGTPISN